MRRCRWSAGRGWATALTACCWSRRSWRPGWLTATDIHWAASTRDLVPAGQTEFAQDPVSGYTASDLKDVHGDGDGGQRAVVRLHGAGGENHRGALGQCVAEQGRQLADLVMAGRDTAQAFPLGEQSRAVT